MIKPIGTALLLLLAGLALTMGAHAQEAENEGIARAALITPKDGHSKQLLDAITEYHQWVAKHEGHHKYRWFEIISGPNTGKYIARTGDHDWADFDASQDWQQEASEAFATNVAPHIADADVWFTKEMREFSHWPESMEGYTHFQVQTWYVHNGKWSEFRAGLTKIVDTLKAANYENYWGFFTVESGGHGNQVQLVSANRGWADMSDPTVSFSDIMTKAMGSREAYEEFMSEWSQTFKTGHNQMVKYMPRESDYGDN